jgi:hypothetical protein
MRPTIVLLAFISCAEAADNLRFSGEVVRGQEFRKSLGSGLVFRLEPNDSGWAITVIPERAADPQCRDYVWVVTPPYRSSNARIINTDYGVKATEALKWSPRDFAFVTNCEDFKLEGDRVDRVLWPANYSEDEVRKAKEKLGTSSLGKGSLKIQDSTIASDGKLGRIERIRFKVEITLPKS